MKYYARRFFHEFVKLDPVGKTVTLPGIMRVYWADFGGGRAKVSSVYSVYSVWYVCGMCVVCVCTV